MGGLNMACTYCQYHKNTPNNTKNADYTGKSPSTLKKPENWQQMMMPDYSYGPDSIYDNPEAGMVPIKGRKNNSSSIYDMPPISSQRFAPIHKLKK